jgi:hypothetical protein
LVALPLGKEKPVTALLPAADLYPQVRAYRAAQFA